MLFNVLLSIFFAVTAALADTPPKKIPGIGVRQLKTPDSTVALDWSDNEDLSIPIGGIRISNVIRDSDGFNSIHPGLREIYNGQSDLIAKWVSDAFAINQGVKLGVGTDSPQRDLHIVSDSGEPTVMFSQSSQGSDGKHWQYTVSGGSWYVQALDDAYSGNTAFRVDRTGATPSLFYIAPPVQADSSITATEFIGPLTGTADKAVELDANPADCSSDQYAKAIDAAGDLTCETVTVATTSSRHPTMSASTMWSTTGTAGDIVYNTTYKHPFIYEGFWYPLGPPQPRYGFLITDEFWGSTGSNAWGGTGFAAGTSGTLTVGEILLRQATASSRTTITSPTTNLLFLGSYDLYMEWLVETGSALASALEDYSLCVGMNDAAAYVSGSLGTDVVAFCYNRGVDGHFWTINGVTNTTPTKTVTSVAITTVTKYRLAILYKAASGAEFFIDGTSVGTIANANLPTGSGRGTHVQARVDKILGSNNADLRIDAFMMWGFFNGARF